ncbi:MAG: hypothetical protein KDC08_10885, partial [Actinobacteria bacterium]|nr:hypothetical protein [Actinomycetota bacterium]
HLLRSTGLEWNSQIHDGITYMKATLPSRMEFVEADTGPIRLTGAGAAKKRPTRKAPAKKAARKAPAKKAPVKKAPAKKAPVKKATAKKAPVKKATAKRAPAKKAPS